MSDDPPAGQDKAAGEESMTSAFLPLPPADSHRLGEGNTAEFCFDPIPSNTTARLTDINTDTLSCEKQLIYYGVRERNMSEFNM